MFHHDTSHFESSRSSSSECRTAPSGCRPSDQANQLRPESTCILLLSTSTVAILLLLSPKADDSHLTVPQRVEC